VAGAAAAWPHPRSPGSPAAVVFSGGRILPSSTAAPQSHYPLGCQTRNCPCATAPPPARRQQPEPSHAHALHDLAAAWLAVHRLPSSATERATHRPLVSVCASPLSNHRPADWSYHADGRLVTLGVGGRERAPGGRRLPGAHRGTRRASTYRGLGLPADGAACGGIQLVWCYRVTMASGCSIVGRLV
jgi:hypothetical protein